jgi:hypothetical protein
MSHEPPSYFRRLFGPENLPNFALFVVAAITACYVARQAKETAKATQAMRDQLPELKKSADAAKLSADIAGRVSVPTLVIEKFESANPGAAALTAMLQLLKIDITIKNYGQTPAFLKWWSIILTCEPLPDIPIYTGYPGCGIFLDKMIVKPNEPFKLPELPFYRRQQISLNDIVAITQRDKILVAYGYICYGDLFGNPLRRLKFCEFVLNLGEGTNGWIEWCPESDPAYTGIDLCPTTRPREDGTA